jgi:hypothetical protein
MNSFNFSENETVEKPTIALFEQLGWETADGNAEVIGEKSSTWGRKTRARCGAGIAIHGGVAKAQS